MKQQLKKLVYQRAIEKYGKISDYHKYRINHEIKRIQQMNGLDYILCMERILTIANQINEEVIMDQQAVNSSFVCYLLGASFTNPIDTDLRFNMPENLEDIASEQSLETMNAVRGAFTAEDELLFFGKLIKYAPKEEPTENR